MTRKTADIPLSHFGQISFDHDISTAGYTDELVKKNGKNWRIRWCDDKQLYDYDRLLLRIFSSLLPHSIAPRHSVYVTNSYVKINVAIAHEDIPSAFDFKTIAERLNHDQQMKNEAAKLIAVLCFLNQSGDRLILTEDQNEPRLQVNDFDLTQNFQSDFFVDEDCFISFADSLNPDQKEALKALDADPEFYKNKMLMLLILAYMPSLDRVLGLGSEASSFLVSRQEKLKAQLLSSEKFINFVSALGLETLNIQFEDQFNQMSSVTSWRFDHIKTKFSKDLQLLLKKQEQRKLFENELIAFHHDFEQQYIEFYQDVLEYVKKPFDGKLFFLRENKLLNDYLGKEIDEYREILISQSNAYRELVFDDALLSRNDMQQTFAKQLIKLSEDALFNCEENELQSVFSDRFMIQFYMNFLCLFVPDLTMMEFIAGNGVDNAVYQLVFKDNFYVLRKFRFDEDQEKRLKELNEIDERLEKLLDALESQDDLIKYRKELIKVLEKTSSNGKELRQVIKEQTEFDFLPDEGSKELEIINNKLENIKEFLESYDSVTRHCIDSRRKAGKPFSVDFDYYEALSELENKDSGQGFLFNENFLLKHRKSLKESIDEPFSFEKIFQNKNLKNNIAEFFAVAYFLNMSCRDLTVVHFNGVEQVRLTDFEMDFDLFKTPLSDNENFIPLVDIGDSALIGMLQKLDGDSEFCQSKVLMLLMIALVPNIHQIIGDGMSDEFKNNLIARQSQLRGRLLSSKYFLKAMLDLIVHKPDCRDNKINDNEENLVEIIDFQEMNNLRYFKDFYDRINLSLIYMRRLSPLDDKKNRKIFFDNLQSFLFELMKFSIESIYQRNFNIEEESLLGFVGLKAQMGLSRFLEKYPLYAKPSLEDCAFDVIRFLSMMLDNFGACVPLKNMHLLNLIKHIKNLPLHDRINAVFLEKIVVDSNGNGLKEAIVDFSHRDLEARDFLSTRGFGECLLFSKRKQISKSLETGAFVLRSMVLLVEECDKDGLSKLRHKKSVLLIFKESVHAFSIGGGNVFSLDLIDDFQAKILSSNTPQELSKVILDIFYEVPFDFVRLFLGNLISYCFCELHLPKLIEFFHLYESTKVESKQPFVKHVLNLNVTEREVMFFYKVVERVVKASNSHKGWTAEAVMKYSNTFSRLAPAPQPALPDEKQKSSASLSDSLSNFFQSSGAISKKVSEDAGPIVESVVSAAVVNSQSVLSSLWAKGVELAPVAKETAKTVSSSTYNALSDWWNSKQSSGA